MPSMEENALAQVVLAAILVSTLIVQAAFPARRLAVVSGGAALCALVSSLFGIATAPELLAGVPWDVIVILVALGLLSQLFVASGVFGVLALRATRWSGAQPTKVMLLFAVGIYAVSAVLNNLTALLLTLPVLLILFQLLGVRRRYVSWTLGVLVVCCNLGGAATPIGDFPAILLLGSGAMGFDAYLVRALPMTLLGLALVLGLVTLIVRPTGRRPGASRGTSSTAGPGSGYDLTAPHPLSSELALATMERLYRNVRTDRRRLAPAAALLAVMVVAWVAVPRETGVTPDLIAWLGAGCALLLAGALGERVLRTKVDAEVTLFLLSLFVMVGSVSRSGLFGEVAGWLQALPVPPLAQLCVFLFAAGLLTGLFSAGPSMAALLEVAARLAEQHPPEAVYVGLALSVCAGSSLFLTAATAGPLAQALTERAGLTEPDGPPVRFGFTDFLPVGLLSFGVIQSLALGWGLWAA